MGLEVSFVRNAAGKVRLLTHLHDNPPLGFSGSYIIEGEAAIRSYAGQY